jgi:hypothetical protein
MATHTAKPFNIFRAGTHTSRSGQTVTVSRADLEQIAQAYDPSTADAPLVVGHPKVEDPRYGRVARLEVVGDQLVAYPDPASVAPEFAAAVNAGHWPHVSASLWPPKAKNSPRPDGWYLRHVGFLGAHPPAIPGLGTVSFAADDDALEFGGPDGWALASLLRRMARLFRGVKRALPAPAEGIDSPLPDWELDSLIDEAARLEADEMARLAATQPSAEFSQPEDPQPENKEADLAAQEDLARRERELADRERLLRRKELEGRINALANVPAGEKTGMIEFAASLDGVEALEFSAGAGKQTAVDYLLEFLARLPAPVALGEVAPPNPGDAAAMVDFGAPDGMVFDPAQTELLRKARAHQAAHNCSLDEALAAVGVR